MFSQLSPNMLKTYESCPRKFYFKYIKNISMPVNDEIFEFGKNIHALASYYLLGENIDKMELALSEKEKNVWNYLKSLEYLAYEVIATEYNLSVKVGKSFFGGRLDALVKKDNRYYILDYKTGSIPKNAKFDYQTIIYTLAVKEFFRTSEISFVYLDLKNKSEIKIDFSKELENEYSSKLIQIENKINLEEDFAKKDKCSCEYSLICY